jgi:DNA-binding transcriptional MerR regulator
MVRIGDFSRLGHVSIKALRFYDEVGLLRPTFVDTATGYRYYSANLLTRLNRILVFKQSGFRWTESRNCCRTTCPSNRCAKRSTASATISPAGLLYRAGAVGAGRGVADPD